MKSLSRRIVSIGLTIVFLVLWLYFSEHYNIYPFGSSAKGHTKMVMTRTVAYNVLCAINAYRVEHSDFQVGMSGKDCMREALEAMQKQNDLTQFRTHSYSTNSWVWLDSWSSPFHLEIRGVTMPNNAFDCAFGKTTYGIVVWSPGENKINEYGKGDDILAF